MSTFLLIAQILSGGTVLKKQQYFIIKILNSLYSSVEFIYSSSLIFPMAVFAPVK